MSLFLVTSCATQPKAKSKKAQLDAVGFLHPGSAISGYLHPDSMMEALSDLGNDAFPQGLESVLDSLHPMGFATDAPVWFSIVLRGQLGVERAAQDIERMLIHEASRPQGEDARLHPGDTSIAQWLQTEPLPHTWLHLRLVGTRSEISETVLDAVSAWAGGVMALGADSEPAVFEAALGIGRDESEKLIHALSTYPDGRIFVLLDAALPTLVFLSFSENHTIADILQDQDLKPQALGAALLSVLKTGRSRHAKSNPLTATLMDNMETGTQAVVVAFNHSYWFGLARALGEIDALQRVLSHNGLLGDVADFITKSRARAARPVALGKVSKDLFSESIVALEALQNGYRIKVAAMYAEGAPPMFNWRNAVPPRKHEVVRSLGSAAITISTGGQAWVDNLHWDEEQNLQDLPLFLQSGLRCGFSCYPALWSAIPLYGVRLGDSLGRVFPELFTAADGLALVHGANLIVNGTQSKRRFAAVLGMNGSRAMLEPSWRPLLTEISHSWAGDGRVTELRVGTDSVVLDTLAGTSQNRTKSPSVLEATFKNVMSRPSPTNVDIDLRFNTRAMVVEATLRPM